MAVALCRFVSTCCIKVKKFGIKYIKSAPSSHNVTKRSRQLHPSLGTFDCLALFSLFSLSLFSLSLLCFSFNRQTFCLYSGSFPPYPFSSLLSFIPIYPLPIFFSSPLTSPRPPHLYFLAFNPDPHIGKVEIKKVKIRSFSSLVVSM